MVRVLAVADEPREALWQRSAKALAPDLLVSCGDLPDDYLDFLVTVLDVPLVWVPGNHDVDRSTLRVSRGGLETEAGLPSPRRSPGGGAAADLRVVERAGLRVAGFGGCPRYRPGPHQWTRWQERRRAAILAWRAGRRPVDLLLSHAPPAGVGDRPDDPAHQGFRSLHRLVDRLRPSVLLHGHVHPVGAEQTEHWLGATPVVNVVGYRVVDVERGGVVRIRR